MPPITSRHRLDPVLLFALTCGVALCWLLAALVVARNPYDLFTESGPIERLSAIYLLGAAAAFGIWMVRHGHRHLWHRAVLLLAAGLRELDWDKAFTDSGVLQLRLYSGDNPLAQKIGGLIVVTVLVWAGLRLLRRDLVPWLRNLRWGGLVAWLIAAVFGLYAISKALDGLGRKLDPLGIQISAWMNTVASRSEEGLELIAAILVVQAVGLVVIGRPQEAAGRD